MATDLKAVIQTDKGDIHLKLFADDAPITVANFVNLAKRGFYRGLNFHRVIAGFMIQGGCPIGSGSGTPGYRFEDEFVASLRHNKAGILSMANTGQPGTNGSQFFITHVPTPHLDDGHTVFGEVVAESDQTIVNAIAKGDKIKDIIIEGDVEALLAAQQQKVDSWNAVLDDSFPDLD